MERKTPIPQGLGKKAKTEPRLTQSKQVENEMRQYLLEGYKAQLERAQAANATGEGPNSYLGYINSLVEKSSREKGRNLPKELETQEPKPAQTKADLPAQGKTSKKKKKKKTTPECEKEKTGKNQLGEIPKVEVQKSETFLVESQSSESSEIQKVSIKILKQQLEEKVKVTGNIDKKYGPDFMTVDNFEIKEDISDREARDLTQLNTKLLLMIYAQNHTAYIRQDMIRAYFEATKQITFITHDKHDKLSTEISATIANIAQLIEKGEKQNHAMAQRLDNLDTRCQKMPNSVARDLALTYKWSNLGKRLGKQRNYEYKTLNPRSRKLKGKEYLHIVKPTTEEQRKEEYKQLEAMEKGPRAFITEEEKDSSSQTPSQQTEEEHEENQDPLRGSLDDINDTQLILEFEKNEIDDNWVGKDPGLNDIPNTEKHVCFGRLEYWSRFKNKAKWAHSFLGLKPTEKIQLVSTEQGWVIFQADVQENTWVEWVYAEKFINASSRSIKYIPLMRWSVTTTWWNDVPHETRQNVANCRVNIHGWMNPKKYIEMNEEFSQKENTAEQELIDQELPYTEADVWNQIWPENKGKRKKSLLD